MAMHISFCGLNCFEVCFGSWYSRHHPSTRLPHHLIPNRQRRSLFTISRHRSPLPPHEILSPQKTLRRHKSQTDSDSEEETIYSLNHCSKWLLRDPQQLSLAPLICSLQYHPLLTAPYKFLSRSIREGGNAFHMAHGRELWDFASVDPELNEVFNDGMECTARITIKALISEYKHGFDCIGSLVDVGGGTGASIAEIVKAYPHVRGTNFDLPHVVATAPPCPGVNHVGGDMLSNIPTTDAIFMKWILHDWSDEDSVGILRNCRKAILEKTGKIIIVDTVLQPSGDGLFDNTGMALDLVMLTFFGGGKERTELEWKKILNEGGFVRYNIIKIPALQSIIEAYPQ